MPNVLVTGANRGLGLEFTRQYAADGYTVIATCRDPMEANDLAAVSGDVNITRLDVSDFSAVDALAAQLDGQPIDILINNAGVLGPSESDTGLDMVGWEQTMRTNAMAPYKLSVALVDQIAASAEKAIIAVTSRLGSITEAGGGFTLYGSSKAALNFSMKSLSIKLADYGIKVAVFHPGWARTRMGGMGAEVDPVDSVAGMRRLTAGLSVADSGKFFQFDGAEVPW